MSTHSQSERRRSPAGFLGAWEDVVGPRGVPSLAARRGRKPRVPLTQLLPALTWHVMQDTGTLAEHLFQLFREPLALGGHPKPAIDGHLKTGHHTT